MTQARREIAALLPSQDVVIEVLDARIPKSSGNPIITELRQTKPCIKVLTKSDLADPSVTTGWLAHFRSDVTCKGFAATTEKPKETARRIAELCEAFSLRGKPGRPVRALIAGVPNVGKSTLINTLMERTVAAVGDRPAVTKRQQRVVLKNGMVLTDSPGIMWPKIEDEHTALRLAVAGSIPDTAVDYGELGKFAARLLLQRYPGLLKTRYKLSETPGNAEALLLEIARVRGALRPGGVADMHKAAEVLIHEIRSGALGRLTLERPGEL